MPHYRDWFAVEASKAVIHPNYRREDSKASAYVDEDVDGFMKLGDIKGEFASKAVIHPNYRPTNGPQDVGSWTFEDNTFRGSKTGEAGHDPGPIGAGSGQFTTGGGGDSLNSWRDVRDHNHGKRSNWDVICDIGTSIKQESVADALTNPDHALGLDVGPVNQTADIWTKGGASTFTVDALLQLSLIHI